MPLAIDADPSSQKLLWEQLLEEAPIADGCLSREDGEKYKGPILPYPLKELSGIPVSIPSGLPVAINKPLTVAVGKAVRTIHFFGNVTMGNGFPVTLEETPVAEYALYYEDDVVERHLLSNGQHYCRASLLYCGKHLDSCARETDQVALLEIDSDFERYQINRWILPARRGVNLVKIVITTLNGAVPLLYGISARIDEDKKY